MLYFKLITLLYSLFKALTSAPVVLSHELSMMRMKIYQIRYRNSLKYLVKELIMIFMVNEASTSVIKGICIIARNKRKGR